MGIMTAIRSQVPVVHALPAPVSSDRGAPVPTVAPVAKPILQTAVRQPERMQAILEPQPAIGEGHPVVAARETVDAARLAYIRASIAAGISPLPLP